MKRCPHCSFNPTSYSDYCDEHNPKLRTERGDALVKALAEFFAGPDVAKHSAALALPPDSILANEAKRFFAVRTLLRINGWTQPKEAEKAIRATFNRSDIDGK
jgi:hypothetical protein